METERVRRLVPARQFLPILRCRFPFFPVFALHSSIDFPIISPLEQGLLTGKYTKETKIPEGQFRNNIPWFQPINRKRVIETLDG
jgi:hypothetical protein